MRALPILAAFIISGCAATNNLSYEEAEKLADRDEATLTDDSHKIYDKAMESALDSSVEQCGMAYKPYSIIFELDGKGKILQSWFDIDTSEAQCHGKTFINHFKFSPPFQPFYGAMHYVGTTHLVSEPITFTPYPLFNPQVTAKAIITEKNSKFLAHISKLVISHKPGKEDTEIGIKSIRLWLNFYSPKNLGATITDDQDYDWNNDVEGGSIPINKILRKNEIITLENFELSLEVDPAKLAKHYWANFHLIIELTDGGSVTTASEQGFL